MHTALLRVASARIRCDRNNYGSLRDVPTLAGHSSLTTIQRYIAVNAEAKRRMVEVV